MQAAGHLAIAALTGSASFILFRSHHYALAFFAFVLHGNVCAFFSSALHELGHGTVFENRRLGRFFLHIYEFLSWGSWSDIGPRHWNHHKFTLTDGDDDLDITCHALRWWTWGFALVFNPARAIGAIRNSREWIFTCHLVLLSVFLITGAWPLVFIVTLAPFFFGTLEMAARYVQHAGLPLHTPLEQCVRSVALPGWLSFLYWHMEYHLEHHLDPTVPCYHLKEFRATRGYPPAMGFIEAWREVLQFHKVPGRCGSVRPGFWQLVTIRFLGRHDSGG